MYENVFHRKCIPSKMYLAFSANKFSARLFITFILHFYSFINLQYFTIKTPDHP